MSDSYVRPPPGDFRVGRVLSRSFELLFGDFLKFFATMLILWLPFSLLGFFGGAYFAAAGRTPQSVNVGAVIGLSFAFIVGALAATILSQAVILYGAFQRMRGRSFGIGESFARGFARFLPILGMLFLFGLGIMGATLLLIFPAFILMTMWYVALPACVVERLGPVKSLGRSRFLTRGYRWRVFGILILILIVNSMVQQLLPTLLGPGIIGATGGLLWLALSGAYEAIVVAVVYHDLRVAKEGIDIDLIAAVFD